MASFEACITETNTGIRGPFSTKNQRNPRDPQPRAPRDGKKRARPQQREPDAAWGLVEVGAAGFLAPAQSRRRAMS